MAAVTQFKIEDVEAAALALLQKTFKDEQPKVETDAMSVADVNEDGDIITNPPAARLYFANEAATPGRDAQRLTYQSQQFFTVMVGAQDYSSRTKERMGCYAMVSLVKNAFAGARLTLADGGKTEPIAYLGAEPYQAEKKAVWYAVRFAIPCVAQFSGANANG